MESEREESVSERSLGSRPVSPDPYRVPDPDIRLIDRPVPTGMRGLGRGRARPLQDPKALPRPGAGTYEVPRTGINLEYGSAEADSVGRRDRFSTVLIMRTNSTKVIIEGTGFI
jgi:hypothetical protein